MTNCAACCSADSRFCLENLIKKSNDLRKDRCSFKSTLIDNAVA
jgi:hypothetical protein